MTHQQGLPAPFRFSPGRCLRVALIVAAATAAAIGGCSPGGSTSGGSSSATGGGPPGSSRSGGTPGSGDTAGNQGGGQSGGGSGADDAAGSGGAVGSGGPSNDAAADKPPAHIPGGDAGLPGPVDDLGYLSRPVPVLWITVDGKAIPRDLKIAGRIKVIEDHDGSLDGIMARTATLDSPIGIEIRGQSSFEFAQKPYGFEVRDDTGEGKAVPLLGLPAEADFVLHSCYADKTCLRNALTYQVGREMAAADGRWAPRTRYVEIFIDGQYHGLYLLVERIKRDKARVNLPAPAADATAGDISGGYIFSQEGDGGRMGADWPSPLDPKGKLVYRYPKAESITAAQKTYLQDATRALAQTLTTEVGLSPALRQRIHVNSWLDYAVIQELSNNVDAFWKSWFLYKAPDAAGGQFFLGPLWDFDLSYGNIIFKKRYCSNTSSTSELVGPLAKLVNHQDFKDALRCRWNTLRAATGPLDVDHLEKLITAFTQHISRAKARDQARWKNIGAWIWPNNYIGASWADEVTYLRYWLRRRLSWVDGSMTGVCTAVPAPAAVTLIEAPTVVKENNVRMPYPGRDAPVYIPIEGTLPANLASWACPK